jgi:hypothetical protein
MFIVSIFIWVEANLCMVFFHCGFMSVLWLEIQDIKMGRFAILLTGLSPPLFCTWFSISIFHGFPSVYFMVFHQHISWFSISIFHGFPSVYFMVFHQYISWFSISIFHGFSSVYFMVFHQYISWFFISIFHGFPSVYFMVFHQYISWFPISLFHGFPSVYFMVFFVFNGFRWEMVYVDIDGIVYHHWLIFFS